MRLRRGHRFLDPTGTPPSDRGLGQGVRIRAGVLGLVALGFMGGVGSARAAAAANLGTETFPCPPELQARTEFWIRIFTEFGKTDKVLHDERYPWIIYEVIDVTGLEAKAASAKTEGRIAYYAELLDSMAKIPPAQFGADQKRVAELLREVPEEALYTRAKERLRTQTGIRENFRAGLERSGRYLDYIAEVLAAQGVPGEVAYLPHVESSFNPAAQSHAGAVGLWQFTKDTGRLFMTVEGDIDERRDPYAASRAAARYLKNSHEKLGSWPLAVVSYNHGLAGVRRAMDALGTNDIVRVLHEYDGPRFGFASQNFYCEFVAAIEVGRNPQRYFDGIFPATPERPQEFVLSHYVKFTTLCSAFGLTGEELARWNPALGRSHREGERFVPKGYVVRLPETIATPEISYASIPAEHLHPQPPRPRGHKVVRGDTLAKIAQKYRVSLADLRGANGLQKSDRIYPGQVLALP